MMRRWNSLEFIILLPTIGFTILAGAALYFLVLRSVGVYADDSIRAAVDSLLRNAVTIADSEVDRQNHDGRFVDPEAALVYKLNARLRFEDFARDQDVGVIVVVDNAADFITGLPAETARRILDLSPAPGIQEVNLPTGDRYFVATSEFRPWGWRIVLAKNAASFDSLVRQVQLIYASSATVLVLLAGLMLLGLRQVLVRPLYRIAADFADGQAPTYRGVREFEYLSNRIGDVLGSLRASSLHLETTLQSMSDAITVYDANLSLVAWNDRYVQLFRYPSSLIRRGVAFADVMRFAIDRGDYGPGDPEEQLADILDRARTLSPPRFEINRPDGTSVEVRRAPMPNGGFVTTYTDITDQKQRIRFEAANEAKSRFLENMSHDLRKPIAAIIEDAQLLRMNAHPAGEGALAGPIASLDANASHLLTMVDEVLEMSRIESGQVEVRSTLVQVAAVVAQAVRVVEPAARSKALAIRTSVAPDLATVTDPRLLGRILLNLLANAVEYTDCGEIEVTAGLAGPSLEITVADTGRGIPQEKLEAIFDKFQRLEPTAGLTQPGMGLGLGLSISREFAHQLGGRLTVRSQVGQGSAFTLTLPAFTGTPQP
jgi:signal transduction histidine kinase